jgi:hypothetical protein
MKAYLHTGAGKTGTSAIQVALARLRPVLADAGIWYPVGMRGSDQRAWEGKVSSGNAVPLGKWLNPELRVFEVDKTETQSWLKSCMSEASGRDLLFSSEMMQYPRPAEAVEFCKFLQSAGYDPIIIFYVRHLADQAISAYFQHLKRGFTTLPNRAEVNDLGSFLRSYLCSYLTSLVHFRAVLPRENFIVRLYERERDNLVPGFLRLLTDKAITIPSSVRILNRSPTAAERILFEYLATKPDAELLCTLASDLLLDRPAPNHDRFFVNAEDFAAFSDRNRTVVDRVNREFMPAGTTLLMKSDSVVIGAEPKPPIEEILSVFAEAFALLAKQALPKL